jgi:flagellar hook-associated protein 2
VPTITSAGLGSGLDVNSIVDQLVALERKPIEKLQASAAGIQSKLSSFGLLQSYLTNLHDAADKLAQARTWWQTAAVSADAGAVGAASSATAAPGSYLVEVSQLAQAQSLSSKAFTGSTATVGSGTLRIELGAWAADLLAFTPGSAAAIDIVVGAADTLAAIRDKINAAKAGVSASIVNDGTGARLVLRASATGVEHAVRVTATDDDGNATDAAGLSALTYDPPNGTGRMTQDMVAKDAAAKVNGLSIASASNTLSGVIDGVTLTLSKVTTAAVDVKVTQATDVMKKAVADFAKAYNDVQKYIADQTRYDPDSKNAAALQGDASTLTVQRQLRAALQGVSSASAVFNRLSSLGLEVQRDGSLKIDDAKLADAMATQLDEVSRAFAFDGGESGAHGFAVTLARLAEQMTESDGVVTRHTEALRERIKRNEKDQDRLEDRVAATRDRLLRQYTALDVQMAKLNGLSNYVTQQMSAFDNLMKRDD